jgi:hypothetical protein
MDGSPHLPAGIRQWYGDSRGRWDGNTLVIDVTNFSPKTDFRGSRENLHLTERWTRTGPTTLEYVVTIEDPTVWTGNGPSAKSSASRASKRTEFITSRAAWKEIIRSRRCCGERAWRSSPSLKDEVLTRQPGTALAGSPPIPILYDDARQDRKSAPPVIIPPMTANGMVRPCSYPASKQCWEGATKGALPCPASPAWPLPRWASTLGRTRFTSSVSMNAARSFCARNGLAVSLKRGLPTPHRA